MIRCILTHLCMELMACRALQGGSMQAMVSTADAILSSVFEVQNAFAAIQLQKNVQTVPPYTLHPTPLTLHPTPLTLHPTPYTLHPSQRTARTVGYAGFVGTKFRA